MEENLNISLKRGSVEWKNKISAATKRAMSLPEVRCKLLGRLRTPEQRKRIGEVQRKAAAGMKNFIKD